MRKKQVMIPRLAAVVTILLFLNLFTFVLAADALLRANDNTPTAAVELPVRPEGPRLDDPDQAPLRQQASDPVYFRTIGEPEVRILDQEKLWRRRTQVAIFHAWYDNETGEITVESRGGDNVIAPGTGNRYYFDIRNTGNTSAYYWLEAESYSTTVTYNGQTVEIPLEIRFSKQRGGYLLGGDSSWEPLTALDGLRDRGGLSSGRYVRYVLDWQWPFEGDDILDTLLGDMAAEDAELLVQVTFHVYAEADDEASGGIPQTGDTSNIALWMGVLVSSGVLLIILLASRRKEKTNGK